MLGIPVWAFLIALTLGSTLGVVTGAAIVTTTHYVISQESIR